MAPAEGARSVTGTPVAARRRPPGIVGVVLTTTLLPDVECHEMTVTKRGRPPIGAVAMTATERKRAQRARERGRRDVLDRDRDRKRAERVAAVAGRDLPAAPVEHDNLIDFAESLTVSQGEHAGRAADGAIVAAGLFGSGGALGGRRDRAICFSRQRQDDFGGGRGCGGRRGAARHAARIGAPGRGIVRASVHRV